MLSAGSKVKTVRANTKIKRRKGFCWPLASVSLCTSFLESRRSAAVFWPITPKKIFRFLVVPLPAVIFSGHVVKQSNQEAGGASGADTADKCLLRHDSEHLFPFSTTLSLYRKKVKQASGERRYSFCEFTFGILAFPFKYSSC